MFGEKTDNFKKALESTQKWAKEYKTANDIPDNLIPENYKYSDI